MLGSFRIPLHELLDISIIAYTPKTRNKNYGDDILFTFCGYVNLLSIMWFDE